MHALSPLAKPLSSHHSAQSVASRLLHSATRWSYPPLHAGDTEEPLPPEELETHAINVAHAANNTNDVLIPWDSTVR